jgi:hypothetical protein
MNKKVLAGMLLITSCMQSRHSVPVELPPCFEISGDAEIKNTQAFIKKDICISCLDLFVARLHTEKVTTNIDFFIQDPDLFRTWRYRYGRQDSITLMIGDMNGCIDTTLDLSTIYQIDKNGNVLWKSVIEIEKIPWILEHLLQD